MQSPDVRRLPRILWTALRRPGAELWRAARQGDQSAMLGVMMQLATESKHPDAYVLDGRPFSPSILVVHSAEGLRAIAAEPAMDKAPTALIAVASSGEVDAYEAIMGASADPRYEPQIEKVHEVIRHRQRGLRKLVRARAEEHLAAPCDFSLRIAQRFTASVILRDIFPARDWTTEAIAKFVDASEENAEVVGPAMQHAAMRGAPAEVILKAQGIADAVARHDALISGIAEEERARQAELGDDAEAARGFTTTLMDAGLSWSDTKALVNTLFAASYETVATALTELVYQLARYPELWDQLKAAEGDARKRMMKHALYEAVRIIDPLPMLLRQAERDCTLQIDGGDGQTRPVEVTAGQLVLGLTARPLLDPHRFPDPLRMRLELEPAQIEVIRLAWGIRAATRGDAGDRFCKGFAYSVGLLDATLESLLDRDVRPELVVDAPIQMFGTRSRKRFRARLRAA